MLEMAVDCHMLLILIGKIKVMKLILFFVLLFSQRLHVIDVGPASCYAELEGHEIPSGKFRLHWNFSLDHAPNVSLLSA